MSEAPHTLTEGELWKLIRGDTLEVLRSMPRGAVDIVVTSPPYNTLGSRVPKVGTGMQAGKGWCRQIAEIGYPDDVPEAEYQAWLLEVVRECLRVAKGLVWVNHKVRYRDGTALHPMRMIDAPVYAEVIWDRTNSMALNCFRPAPSHEGVWAFGLPHHWDRRWDPAGSVWRIPHEQSVEGHPCPFPVALPRRCIQSSCPPGGIVLDPFIGSGSTILAALEVGCRGIGIDREERFLDVAPNRRAGVTPGLFPPPPPPKHRRRVSFLRKRHRLVSRP